MEELLIVMAALTIPLAGISVGAFKVWLRHQREQHRLGTATHELEGTVESLSRDLAASNAERDRLVERIENLETIVTSRVWSAGSGPEDHAEAGRRRADLEMTLDDLPRDRPAASATRAAALADEINS